MTGTGGSRLTLGLGAAAVAFAAADTYVVVLALPDMMSGVGLSVDQLQRATPIVSGFLLGYVAVLPLLGRIADLVGRVPVLLGSLVLFGLGALLTAASYDLASMVTGRFLQGVGGGGLVPATLALVADRYPAERRGFPLGVVSAVQEVGSLLGPVYAAVVLALAGWRDIFWVNLAVALVLGAALWFAGRRSGARPPDPVGMLLALLALGTLVLVLVQPAALTEDVTLGLAFVPFSGHVSGPGRWASPVGVLFLLLVLAVGVRGLVARHPLIDVRRAVRVARQADPGGSLLLAAALGGVVLAFATTDPRTALLAPGGRWWLAAAVVAAAGFWWRVRTGRRPLLPRGALAAPTAWGALLVSLLVGAALIAALVDVPLFARLTVAPTSQPAAGLVLLRFLVAVPVGAVLGGWALRRLTSGPVAAAGLVLAAAGLGWMATWGPDSLSHPAATVSLLGAGLGFGMALAPVNAALLAATDHGVHGIASALLVAARMVGMLVGLAVLTTVGLHRFYEVQAQLPGPVKVCGTATVCPSYTTLLRSAALTELHTVFLGAACCALLAGLVGLATLRGRRVR